MAAKRTATPDVRPGVVEGVPLDRAAQTALRGLRALKVEEAALKVRRARLESKIKTALGDAESGTVRGRTAVTYRRSIRSSLSATMVAKKYPEVAQECRELREIRTLIVVDSEG